MLNIIEAVATTAVAAGPTRSDVIQAAMQKAVEDLIAAHNAKWQEWSKRADQSDGAEAPVLRDDDIRDAKIAARAAAKTAFHTMGQDEAA